MLSFTLKIKDKTRNDIKKKLKIIIMLTKILNKINYNKW